MRKMDYSKNKVHLIKPFDSDYVASVLAEIRAREWAKENGLKKVRYQITPKEESEDLTASPVKTITIQ